MSRTPTLLIPVTSKSVTLLTLTVRLLAIDIRFCTAKFFVSEGQKLIKFRVSNLTLHKLYMTLTLQLLHTHLTTSLLNTEVGF